MSESIHGHEVLEMLLAQPQGVTKGELKAQMLQKFGTEARYHTCSAADMDADALIEFLAARGKFVDAPAGFTTEAEKICNH
ncbi:YecH family protein [Shewanella avicenniae]|uniref:YecH family protein n=1 Tax=Shewanella avicenniae TaxID=2814294 RepID=A0ABX7QTW3_9GAMM|nr:YecH family metal-binding protein [Shewanella avicenniae]QSX34869.1 YecH family protein [Shewanella avicenniae]